MRSKTNVLFLDFFALICAFSRTIDWNIGKPIKMGDNFVFRSFYDVEAE